MCAEFASQKMRIKKKREEEGEKYENNIKKGSRCGRDGINLIHQPTFYKLHQRKRES